MKESEPLPDLGLSIITGAKPQFRLPWVSALVFLFVRGFLMWLYLPLGVVIWIVGWPLWNRRQVSCGQLLGWIDLNAAACIQRSVIRPFMVNPVPWTPFSAMASTSHRVSAMDPV